MDSREMVIAWLNDAYAMENHLVQVLEKQIDHAEDDPMVQNKIREHCDQTRRHAEMMKERVEGLGESVSALKSGMASVVGTMQGMTTGMAEDTMIKDALADFGAENFEIACYKALIEAANQIGEPRIADVCTQVLGQEQAMAQWLEQNLPMVVQKELRQPASAMA